MKFKNLLAVAAVALCGTAKAQITSGGKYYIQNVESGLYLCGANSWGTQGSVSTQGDLFTANLSNGKYALVDNDLSVTSNALGTNLFTDNSGNNWTIEPVDGEEGVYTIKNDGGYIMQSGENGGHIGYLAKQDATLSNAAKWYFLTEEEAKAKLAATPWGSSTPASFLLGNANFSRNHNTVWTIASTPKCTNSNLSGGTNDNRCAESFHSPFTISQTINVPNGVYGVTAQGFVRGDGGNIEDAVFFANEVTQAFPVLTGTENSMTDASNSFAQGNYTIEEFKVTVTDGKLTIGVKNTSNALWCIWDNLNLTYYGIDITTLKEALDARIAVAEAITNDMNAAVKSALSTALANAKSCAATKDAIEAALAELNPAIEAANASAAQYAEVAAKVAGLDDAGKAAFKASESGAKYEAKTLAAGDNITTDYIAAVKAQTATGSNFTALIVNPEVNGADGWTISRPKGGNGPLFNGTAFEYWGGNASSRAEAQFDYYQVIEGLPNGKYRVSADMYNSLNGEAGAEWAASSGLYANNEKVLVNVDGDQLNNYSVEVSVTSGTLSIGVKSFDYMAARWFVADNFKLTLVEAGLSLDDYYSTIATLLEEASGLQTSKQSLGTAESLDQYIFDAYDYESVTDKDALQGMIDGLTLGIENSTASVNAYADLKNALEKNYLADRSDVFGNEFTYLTEAQTMYADATATTEEVQEKADGMLNAYRAYVREIVADDYTEVAGVAAAREKDSWEYTTNPQNNATFNNAGNMDITGNTMWENWRGAGLTEGDMKQTVTGLANGKYFLKMVSFTRQSPNEKDYIYIKSGNAEAQAVSLGDAATSNGFINITDPIEVTNGEVEIGLHVGSGCDWAAIGGVALYKYADAATMAVNSEAQYGTFCAPFDVEVPAGVTASTATLDGSTVVLAPVGETIPANTPVVLEGALDATIVYGKAVAGTPVAGVLTGVYAITQAPMGSYVLQNQNDKVAFYLVDSEIIVPANRAYLSSSASEAKVLNFPAATAINALTTGTVEAIYDANGVKQNKLQKGMNIIMVNGQAQKVLVK